MEHDIIQKCWAYFVSCVQINTPCSWDVFTPITPLGRQKSAQPFTSLLPLRQTIPFTTIPNPPTKWSAAECVNLNPINLWTPDLFHIFCTVDFLEMFVLVSGIPNIQTKISFTGEPWSKTLRDIPLYLSVNRDPHFMADEIIPYYNRVVSSPSPGPSTAYISFQHSSLFWSLRWCFVLFVVETKLLKHERSYSRDHQNSPNLQKRQSTTLPQGFRRNLPEFVAKKGTCRDEDEVRIKTPRFSMVHIIQLNVCSSVFFRYFSVFLLHGKWHWVLIDSFHEKWKNSICNWPLGQQLDDQKKK